MLSIYVLACIYTSKPSACQVGSQRGQKLRIKSSVTDVIRHKGTGNWTQILSARTVSTLNSWSHLSSPVHQTFNNPRFIYLQYYLLTVLGLNSRPHGDWASTTHVPSTFFFWDRVLLAEALILLLLSTSQLLEL